MKYKLVDKLEECAHHFLQSIKQEGRETKQATLIVQKYVRTGELTEAEEKIIKEQVFDSLKIIGVVVPFILIPGASIVMPILIKVAEKKGIELLPSSFNEENHEPYVPRIPKVKVKDDNKPSLLRKWKDKVNGKGKRVHDRPDSSGTSYLDNRDRTSSLVVEKTSSSIRMQHYSTSKNGIHCKNWYELGWWNKYFEILK